jgi:TRAP-type C4-dicarboxylate transport system permease small subunit
MVLGTCDVFGRFALNRPILGALEISSIMMGLVVLLGWAPTQSQGQHVKVELLTRRLPPRARTVLEQIVRILLLVLFAVVAQQSWRIAATNYAEGRTLQTVDIPIGFTYFLVPVGSLLILTQLAREVLYSLLGDGKRHAD